MAGPGQAPRVRRFSELTVKVGRASDCTLCIDEESVSRQHCQIYRGADGWWVEDLGSANGTLVAGLPISGPQLVDPGVSIQVGDVLLRIRSRAAAKPKAFVSLAKPAAAPEVSVPTSGQVRRKLWAARAVKLPAPATIRHQGSHVGRTTLVVAVVMAAAIAGGWSTARGLDAPLDWPRLQAPSCGSAEPLLLQADAAADAAARETNPERAVHAGLQALLRVEGTACAPRSRALPVLVAALARLENQRMGHHANPVRGLAWLDSDEVAAVDDAGTVMIWQREAPGRPLHGISRARSVAGTTGWLAVGETDGQVRWFTAGDTQVQAERHGDRPVEVVHFGSDGRLVSVDIDGEVVVWTHHDRDEQSAWRATSSFSAWPGVRRVELVGDQLLVVGDGRAAVWQLGRRSLTAQPLRPGTSVTVAMLDATGTHAVTGDASGAVVRWPLRRGARAEPMTAHTQPVQALAWVDDGIASVASDDLRISELSRRVRRKGPPLVLVAELPSLVDTLAVAGGGRWLVGTGPDGALVQWDLQQRSRRLEISVRVGHEGAVTSTIAAADWVVTGGGDGAVRGWPLDGSFALAGEPTVATAIATACRALGFTAPGCRG